MLSCILSYRLIYKFDYICRLKRQWWVSYLSQMPASMVIRLIFEQEISVVSSLVGCLWPYLSLHPFFFCVSLCVSNYLNLWSGVAKRSETAQFLMLKDTFVSWCFCTPTPALLRVSLWWFFQPRKKNKQEISIGLLISQIHLFTLYCEGSYLFTKPHWHWVLLQSSAAQGQFIYLCTYTLRVQPREWQCLSHLYC